MSLVTWQEQFKTGIDEVDFEHQELIELINLSFEEAKGADSAAALLQSLGEIYEKISAHFALEEKGMKSHNYAHYEEHKEDHEHLLDVICDIMDDCMDSPELDEAQFGRQLEQWFIGHFSSHDARLHGVLGV